MVIATLSPQLGYANDAIHIARWITEPRAITMRDHVGSRLTMRAPTHQPVRDERLPRNKGNHGSNGNVIMWLANNAHQRTGRNGVAHAGAANHRLEFAPRAAQERGKSDELELRAIAGTRIRRGHTARHTSVSSRLHRHDALFVELHRQLDFPRLKSSFGASFLGNAILDLLGSSASPRLLERSRCLGERAR